MQHRRGGARFMTRSSRDALPTVSKPSLAKPANALSMVTTRSPGSIITISMPIIARSGPTMSRAMNPTPTRMTTMQYHPSQPSAAISTNARLALDSQNKLDGLSASTGKRCYGSASVLLRMLSSVTDWMRIRMSLSIPKPLSNGFAYVLRNGVLAEHLLFLCIRVSDKAA